MPEDGSRGTLICSCIFLKSVKCFIFNGIFFGGSSGEYLFRLRCWAHCLPLKLLFSSFIHRRNYHFLSFSVGLLQILTVADASVLKFDSTWVHTQRKGNGVPFLLRYLLVLRRKAQLQVLSKSELEAFHKCIKGKCPLEHQKHKFLLKLQTAISKTGEQKSCPGDWRTELRTRLS